MVPQHHPLRRFGRLFLVVSLLIFSATASAQKVRPDAFPPLPDPDEPKGFAMASTVEEMRAWDRYPTYPVYVAMMQQLADSFPALCRLDTIGTSLEGRLLLALSITGPGIAKESRPQFFYSSTMHGDEVTGFYLMLRLCDTLLRSYGSSPAITRLLDNTCIVVNPNANPDGTYHGGDNSIDRAQRYNANGVDLNRNYPDPFGTDPLDTIQRENQLMIDYVNRHHFRMAANLHGGSEVLNYPWDSFTSRQRQHPDHDWWQQVCRRFVDTVRSIDSQRYRDVSYSNGYIAGGDWYVISNGRQDYFNYYNGIRELTLEVSSTKKLACSLLPGYWRANAQALINFIDEVHNVDSSSVACPLREAAVPLRAYPNPTRGRVTVESPAGRQTLDLSQQPAGVYVYRFGGQMVRIVKF